MISKLVKMVVFSPWRRLGSITGRTADFIIYDDPHEIGDWNNERKLTLVRDNFNTILSQLQHRSRDHGKVLVVAHRVSENDLSAVLLQEKRWKRIRLPLVAVRRQSFELGHELDPGERRCLTTEGLPRRRNRTPATDASGPSLRTFLQQGCGSQATLKPRANHFQTFAPYESPLGPVVLSIDPGHGGGANASRSVIQASILSAKRFYLIDQFCDQCDLKGFVTRFGDLRKIIVPASRLSRGLPMDRHSMQGPGEREEQIRSQTDCSARSQGNPFQQSPPENSR